MVEDAQEGHYEQEIDGQRHAPVDGAAVEDAQSLAEEHKADAEEHFVCAGDDVRVAKLVDLAGRESKEWIILMSRMATMAARWLSSSAEFRPTEICMSRLGYGEERREGSTVKASIYE